MKLLMSIILLFGFFYGDAQVHYQVTYSNEGVFGPYSTYGPKVVLKRNRHRLLFNKDLSFFYTLIKDRDPLKKNDLDSVELNHSLFYNKEEKKTYQLKVMPKEIGPILVQDTLKNENWTFTSSKKKIKGFICKMAMRPITYKDTIFVWYTDEIAYPFGPGSYQGFPGLVLEVVDVFTHTRIIAVEIKEKPVNVSLPPYQIMTRQRFSELYD